MTVAWLLACAGVLLAAPTRSPAPARAQLAAPRRAGGRDRSRSLAPLAVVALGAACVLVGGPRSGPAAAVVVCPLAWWALDRMRRRPVAGARDPALPLTLDLVAAALRAGRPVADALSCAAPAAGPGVREALQGVAGMLRLGADPDQAWDVGATGPLDGVARVAVRSAGSGIKLAAAFERLAAQLRAEHGTRATARAHRAGITAMAPLAACFLPAFVCLGIVPVVVGIAGNAVNLAP